MSQLFLPLLIPLFGGIFCVIFWGKPFVQTGIFLLSVGLSLWFSIDLLINVLATGIKSAQIGNWQAPFGITLVADLLSAGVMVVVAFVTLMVAIYSQQSMDKSRIAFGFFPVLLFLLFGVFGALLAGDVFNLYVWFEVIMVTSFVLLSLGGTENQLEGAVKYLAINFLASALIIAGIGVLYAITGTLNMADLAQKIPLIENTALPSLAAVFFLVGFGIKSAVFPLYFWLPASYPTPPVAITAMVGGMLTKIGAYVLIRYFTLIFTSDITFTHNLLIFAAVLTMVSGGLGAIAQVDFHKILSFSIVSQIGYIMLGLGLFTPLALAGAIFFLIHNILVKTNLFLISGIVYASNKSYKLSELGGVYKRLPFIAFLFVVSGFSLTGLPPLTGFWGKFLLATAGFEKGEYFVVAIAIATGILSLFYITKVWNEVFWKKDPRIGITKDNFSSQAEFLKEKALLVIPVGLITAVIIIMGCFPGFFIHYAQQAAEQLMDKEHYINAVMVMTKGKE